MSADNICQCRTLPIQRRSIEDSILQNPPCYHNIATTVSHPPSKLDPRFHLPLSIPPPPQQPVQLQLSVQPEEHLPQNNKNRESISKGTSFKEQIKQKFSQSKKPSIFSNFHSTSKLSCTPLTPVYKNISKNIFHKSSEVCNSRHCNDDKNNNNVVCNNFLIDKGVYGNKSIHCCRHHSCHASTNPRPTSQSYEQSANQSKCSNPLYYRTIQNAAFNEQQAQLHHHQHIHAHIQHCIPPNTANTFPKGHSSIATEHSSNNALPTTTKPTKITSTTTPTTSHSFDNITPTFLRMKSPNKTRFVCLFFYVLDE